MKHQMWEELLHRMSEDRGGSPDMLAKVLTRVALADGPVPHSAISKGSMLIRGAALASGTVGKAVEALIGEGLLIEGGPYKERSARSSGHAAPVQRQVGHHRDPHWPATRRAGRPGRDHLRAGPEADHQAGHE